FRLHSYAQRVGHEGATRLDTGRNLRVPVAQFGAAALVEQRYAVLDIGPKVGRAGGRDDVALDGLARFQRFAGTGIDRRVHPFVEVDQMAGVENEVEEGGAQVLARNGIKGAAADADADRFVPFRGAGKIRHGEALQPVG